ncbi:MAG: ABC transporter substrate-binding protein [Thermodesulfobacteriota bacterium]|nr:ABC transporter substrate-binding protein [Thermodesulfobacteriota bacterium]
MTESQAKWLVNFSFFVSAILAFFICIMIHGSAFASDKPEFIHTAAIGDFSGPYAPSVGSTRPGTEDAWRYINEELGGVHGVEVKPVIRDMTGKVALGLSMYNEVINLKPKPKFVDIFITPLSEALRERYVEDDVVGLHAGAIVSLYPQANSYAYYPLYPEQLTVIMKWIKDNWKKKGTPRFGIMTWDSSFGRAIITDEFFAYAEKIGVEMIKEPQLFGVRDVDVTTQLIKLRAQKPDYLLSALAGAGPLTIKKGCKEMGWNVGLINAVLEWGMVDLDTALFEGDMGPMPMKSFDETDDPSIQKVMKYYNLNKRTKKDRALFYLIGWYGALLEHKIMTDVVEKHGWKGLNTKNIKEALNNLNDFAPLQGLTRLSFSDRRRTPKVTRIYKCQSGKLLPISDFLEVPDLRPAQYR